MKWSKADMKHHFQKAHRISRKNKAKEAPEMGKTFTYVTEKWVMYPWKWCNKT